MKQRKSVFFEDNELHLLEFSESKGNFSEYVKELIKLDQEAPRKVQRKKSIYEIYKEKAGE